jgi:hypothetical protein
MRPLGFALRHDLVLRNDLRQRLAVMSAERDAYLKQRDDAIGEAQVLLAQRDSATVERDVALQQRDEALGQLAAALKQRDTAIGERAEAFLQRDQAIGVRNDAMMQRDAAFAAWNAMEARFERAAHRALVTTRPAALTPERILLHIHLAKTGGVTLNNIFVRNLAPEEYLRVEMSPADESALGTWSYERMRRALAVTQSSSLRAVWGHYRPDVRTLVPRRCSMVTILRDPVDRIVSEFYYRRFGASDNPPATLRDYAFRKRHYDLRFDNYITRILSGRPDLDPSRSDANTGNSRLVDDADFDAAAKTLADFLVVGVLDCFDEMLLVLAGELRLSLSDIVYTRDNVTEDRAHIDDVERDVHEKIAEWNRYDVELVKQARTHLMLRISIYRSYPTDFHSDLALFRKLNTMYQNGVSTEQIREAELNASKPTPYEPPVSRRLPPLGWSPVNPLLTSTRYPER